MQLFRLTLLISLVLATGCYKPQDLAETKSLNSQLESGEKAVYRITVDQQAIGGVKRKVCTAVAFHPRHLLTSADCLVTQRGWVAANKVRAVVPGGSSVAQKIYLDVGEDSIKPRSNIAVLEFAEEGEDLFPEFVSVAQKRPSLRKDIVKFVGFGARGVSDNQRLELLSRPITQSDREHYPALISRIEELAAGMSTKTLNSRDQALMQRLDQLVLSGNRSDLNDSQWLEVDGQKRAQYAKRSGRTLLSGYTDASLGEYFISGRVPVHTIADPIDRELFELFGVYVAPEEAGEDFDTKGALIASIGDAGAPLFNEDGHLVALVRDRMGIGSTGAVNWHASRLYTDENMAFFSRLRASGVVVPQLVQDTNQNVPTFEESERGFFDVTRASEEFGVAIVSEENERGFYHLMVSTGASFAKEIWICDSLNWQACADRGIGGITRTIMTLVDQSVLGGPVGRLNVITPEAFPLLRTQSGEFTIMAERPDGSLEASSFVADLTEQGGVD